MGCEGCFQLFALAFFNEFLCSKVSRVLAEASLSSNGGEHPTLNCELCMLPASFFCSPVAFCLPFACLFFWFRAVCWTLVFVIFLVSGGLAAMFWKPSFACNFMYFFRILASFSVFRGFCANFNVFCANVNVFCAFFRVLSRIFARSFEDLLRSFADFSRSFAELPGQCWRKFQAFSGQLKGLKS